MYKLSLVTPYKKIVTDLEVEEVIVPGAKGQLDILPNHSPLMTTLETGVVSYRPVGESTFKKVAISWGYCEVSPQSVILLAQTAETADEIDVSRAKEAIETSKKRLADAGLAPNEVLKFQRKIKRAQTRIDVNN